MLSKDTQLVGFLKEPFNPRCLSLRAVKVKSILENQVLLILLWLRCSIALLTAELLHHDVILIYTLSIGDNHTIGTISQNPVNMIIFTMSARHLRTYRLIFTWQETDGGRQV